MNIFKKINIICWILVSILFLISFVEPFNKNGYGIIILFYIVPIFGIETLIYNIYLKKYKLIIFSLILIFAFPITWSIGYFI